MMGLLLREWERERWDYYDGIITQRMREKNEKFGMVYNHKIMREGKMKIWDGSLSPDNEREKDEIIMMRLLPKEWERERWDYWDDS